MYFDERSAGPGRWDIDVLWLIRLNQWCRSEAISSVLKCKAVRNVARTRMNFGDRLMKLFCNVRNSDTFVANFFLCAAAAAAPGVVQNQTLHSSSLLPSLRSVLFETCLIHEYKPRNMFTIMLLSSEKQLYPDVK
ncbi:hypothetical protein F2P81_021085 [Scophthalmus maximus]|uniref:Uncharacterized protein n=1 Tax=Scophthalmus maximus TaxID=52904 RepID=A0A6A4S2F6_SCOMX|nr:hypothetical protein F2P81_021085 [Scophthalmus maximus]